MTRSRGIAVVLAAAAATACGDVDREEVEQAVRDRPDVAAGPIAAVRCERAERMWGCLLRLRDGREQACQVTADGGQVGGVACQPLRGE